MSRYQSVLCAVDLTPNSFHVLEAAKSITPKENIQVLHICEHPITGYGEQTGHNLRVTEAQIRQSAFPALKEIVETAELNVKQSDIRFGSPAEVIHQTAIDNGNDLIIVGSHGKSGLTLLLGSTSNQVLHGSPCDLLTVRI